MTLVLDMEVGLSPGDFVLDGDPAAPPPISGPYMLRPNSCMDQDDTRRGAKPPPRRLLDVDPAPPPQKGGGAPKFFCPCLLWPNGWMDEAGT